MLIERRAMITGLALGIGLVVATYLLDRFVFGR